MIIDKDTPGAARMLIFLDGNLVGGVVRANLEEGWVDAHVVRECAGRRTWTAEIERQHGCVTLQP